MHEGQCEVALANVYQQETDFRLRCSIVAGFLKAVLAEARSAKRISATPLDTLPLRIPRCRAPRNINDMGRI